MGSPGHSRVIKFALFPILLFLLSSCFSSDQPLLGPGDTPLPTAFYVLTVDANGKPLLDAHGQADVKSVTQVGSSYKVSDAKTSKMVTLRAWDSASSVYAVQVVSLEADAPQVMKLFYGLAAIKSDTLAVIFPNADPNLDNALGAIGVAEKSRVHVFSSQAQLFDGLNALSHHLDKAIVMRSRIYLSQDEARMLSDIAAAQASAQNGASSPAPSAAGAPPSAPAQGVDLAQVNPVTDPKRLASDPGADAPNSCDEQAANPRDPYRMAAGVVMEKMVPRLAQQECERAIAKYPNTMRFRYQLGRALYVGNSPGPALGYLRDAAAAGYPAAFLTLGQMYGAGAGVASDIDTAQQMFRKAMAGGVDAKDDLGEYVFIADGYAFPQVMQGVYDNRLSAEAMAAQGPYWLVFLDLYRNRPDCARLVSDGTFGKFYLAGQFGELKGVFGALAEAHRGPSNGDFGRDAQQGWNAGMDFTKSMLGSISRAKEDAQLFYDRHGCNSPVANRFFSNIAMVARQM